MDYHLAEYRKNLGRGINTIRRALGYSLIDAAAMLGISVDTLSHIESGDTSADLSDMTAFTWHFVGRIGVSSPAAAESDEEPKR